MPIQEYRDQVKFTIRTQEEDIEIRGNAMASGDDDVDREAEDWIIDQLNSGNEWAWCFVTVTASIAGFEGTASLGGCSYESRQSFIDGGYYEGLCDEALDDLDQTIDRCMRNIPTGILQDIIDRRSVLIAEIISNLKRGVED